MLNMTEILVEQSQRQSGKLIEKPVSIEAKVLAEIAQRPETIASKQRVQANRALSPQERDAKVEALMAKVRARMTITAQ